MGEVTQTTGPLVNDAEEAARLMAEALTTAQAEIEALRARVEAIGSMALAALDCGQTLDPREVLATLTDRQP